MTKHQKRKRIRKMKRAIDKWKKAALVLKNGGVVIIPSESAYGLAALASDPRAVAKLYKIKGRPDSKPSLLIVNSITQAKELVSFTLLAKNLIEKYWPGALTLVLKAKNSKFSSLIYGAEETLAVRLSPKKELQALASKVGPFILPSANFNQMPAPFKIEDIDLELIKLVDFFLDEPTDGNPVSTLVDARGEDPIVLRAGAVSLKI
jgi:L-threonylcarbamoyladenylate synthase